MKIHSTYWIYMRRACAQLLAHDPSAVARVNVLADACADEPLHRQHEPVGQLFNLLGSYDALRELGFLLGRQIPATAYGELALGLRIAPTLRDALQLIARYHQRVIPLVSYGFSESGARGRFTVGFRWPMESRGEALIVSGAVAIVDSEIVRITGHKGGIRRIELTASSRGWEPLYEKHGMRRPEVRHAVNAVVLDRAVLDLPGASADPETFNEIVRTYDEMLAVGDAARPVMVKVRERIMSSIQAPPSIDALAKALDMSSRGLRHHLMRQGTSFREIVRSCRTQYASALLANPELTIAQVAVRMGFDDPAAFAHGFKRWIGTSPSEFRRRGR